MGGGTTSTSYVKNDTSNIPEYAAPYFSGLLASAQANTDPATNPYIPYGSAFNPATGKVEQQPDAGQIDPNTGQPKYARIAGFNQNQIGTQNAVMNQQTPGQFGVASDLASTAGIGSLVNSQYDPSQFNASKATAGQVSGLTMATPQEFNQAMADKYMSPYTQSVLDIQRREAIKVAQQQQLAQDLGAARQGSYGGSRQLIAALGRERYLGQNLSDIQAKGMQSAYENAQSQFERDRAARMMAEGKTLDAGMQARLANAQYATQVSLADAQAQMDAQRMAEQSKQFGAQQGLAGLAQANQSAGILGNLGGAEQAANMARLGQQAAAGKEQQALTQAQLDQQYKEYQTAVDYPKTQMEWMSQILRGLPVTPNTQSTVSTPNPSLISQVANVGLGAAGLSKIV